MLGLYRQQVISVNSYKKLGKNVLLLTIGNFSSKLLSFLLVPLYTAILTTSEYGTADLITTTANLLMPIVTLSIFEAVLRFSLDAEEDRSQIFTIGLYITVIGIIVISCALLFARSVDSLKPYVLYFALYYASLAFYNLILQFIKGIEKVAIYSIAGVMNTFIFISCNIVFIVILRIGVRGYLLSFILGHTISALYAFLSSKSYNYIVSFLRIRFRIFLNMLRYSFPLIPNSISWWISNSSDKYILTFFYGVAINGTYSVGYKIPSILTITISIFISAWQISSVEEFGSKKSMKFFSDVYDKYECLLYLGGSVLIGFTKILATFLFQKEFLAAWVFTPILICASIYNSLSAFYGTIYTSSKKTKMLFYSTLIGAGANILLNFSLIPRFSAIGASLATMISYMIVWIIRFFDSRKIMKFHINVCRNALIHGVLLAETALICLDINPFYSVSMISVLLIIVLCKNSIIDAVMIPISNHRSP